MSLFLAIDVYEVRHCRFVARINELRDRINASEKPMRVRSFCYISAGACLRPGIHSTHVVLTVWTSRSTRAQDRCAVQIAVVGGGPGGVELALALQNRLRQDRVAAGRSEDSAPDIR